MSSVVPRMRSLDGLRGAAALVVVFHHVSLAARPELGEAAWAWLTGSPLKLLFPGSEAVLVFFVLSGLVVALPALQGGRPGSSGFSWAKYYPARLLRLYLPVFAVLLMSAALIVLLPRDRSAMPAGSWMADTNATAVTPLSLLSEASLARRSYDIDNVLWSLRWEVVFSLLLPVFVWIALRLAWHPLVSMAACLVATVLGRVLEAAALVYLPLFLLGSILAAQLHSPRRGSRLAGGAEADGGAALVPASARRPPWLLPLAAVLAGALLVASWLVRPLDPPPIVRTIAWGLAGAGAALTVVLAVAWPLLRCGLETRPLQWLGKVSFSLYLVHVPILATLVYLFGSSRWWVAGLVAVPLSLVVAALFQRWIEAPSHRLARAVGARAGVLGARISGRRDA